MKDDEKVTRDPVLPLDKAGDEKRPKRNTDRSSGDFESSDFVRHGCHCPPGATPCWNHGLQAPSTDIGARETVVCRVGAIENSSWCRAKMEDTGHWQPRQRMLFVPY